MVRAVTGSANGIRYTTIDSRKWFIGRDVAKFLGYTNVNRTVKGIPDEYKRREKVDTQGGAQEVTLTTRDGFLILIRNSGNLSSVQKSEIFKQLGVDVAVSRKEIEFLQLLEEVISPLGFTLERQYVVGNYRLDGFIPELGLAVEYDEAHHKRQKDKDKERERAIQREIGCTFVRVSYKECDSVNVGYVVKAIMATHEKHLN